MFGFLKLLASVVAIILTAQIAISQTVEVQGVDEAASAFAELTAGNRDVSVADPQGGPPRLQFIAEPRVDPQLIPDIGLPNALQNAADSAMDAANTLGISAERIGVTDLLVFEVTEAELNDLLASGTIQSVVVDRLDEPHMASAAPGIQLPRLHAENVQGLAQSVVVMDTGVDPTHPHLLRRVTDQACFSTNNSVARSLCPNGESSQLTGGAAAPCDTTVIRSCDHGTHVAGIAAGSASNASDSGVAPLANVIAIQVFSRFNSESVCGVGNAPCLRAYNSDQLAALSYIERTLVNRHPIAAINMSLGGGQYTTCPGDVRAALIGRLRALGIATVISSGNSGYPDHVGAPGCIPQAVTVGAVFDNGSTTWFSNSGEAVDLLAPGASIQAAVPGGGTGYKSGTSMAAPMVAGLITALQAYAPQPVDEIERILADTGVSMPMLNPGRDRPWIRAHDAWVELDSTVPNTPDVWMRDQWADSGQEPNQIGQSLSGSPYIWFRHQQDCVAAAHQSQDPEFGDPSFGCVKLHNRGRVAAGGELHLYWARGNIDRTASWTPIGKLAMTVPPTSTEIVNFPWFQVPHPGHYCAMARWVPEGADPNLSFPEGFQNTIRNSNDHIWRNFDTVDRRSGRYPSGLTFSSNHPGQINLAIEINALGPQDRQLLGELLISLGVNTGNLPYDPTQDNIQKEGDTLIIPLQPGVTYMPEINLPQGVEHEFKVEFRFRPIDDERNVGPLVSVRLSDVADVDVHKMTGDGELASFTYEVVD